MNLNQLRYFHVVVTAGNYTRAAEELGVSQPAVHRAVRSLEKACGAKLIERVGRRAYPTAAGSALQEYAAQIASLARRAEDAIVEKKSLASGNISIGTGTPAAYYFLPNVLAGWMAKHSRVTVSITVGQTLEMHKFLLEDRIDLLLSTGLLGSADLQRQFIFSDRLVVASAPGYPLAKPGRLSVPDLSNERTILPPRDSVIRREIEEVEDQYGVRFRPVAEASHQDTIKWLCMAGVGIAVLPRSVVADEISRRRLRLLRVEGFPRSRAYFLFYRAGKALTPEIQSLLTAINLWVREKDLH